MKAKTISPRKLAQNNVSAESPFTVAQKIPVSAPDLDFYTGGGDSVK
jgi:hypothetical protein